MRSDYGANFGGYGNYAFIGESRINQLKKDYSDLQRRIDQVTSFFQSFDLVYVPAKSLNEIFQTNSSKYLGANSYSFLDHEKDYLNSGYSYREPEYFQRSYQGPISSDYKRWVSFEESLTPPESIKDLRRFSEKKRALQEIVSLKTSKI